MNQNKLSYSILYTGGATGADKEWINSAHKKGHIVKIYRFDGVKHTRIETSDPISNQYTDIETIENKDYEHESKKAMQIAAEHMKIPIPSDAYTLHLINRDYYMIQNPDSLYAIGTFCTKGRLRIDGHTGWIVEMFVDKLIYGPDFVANHGSLPVYFLCQQMGRWYQLVYDVNMHLSWNHIKKPEEPNGRYIGVGSRNLSMHGKLEITYL